MELFRAVFQNYQNINNATNRNKQINALYLDLLTEPLAPYYLRPCTPIAWIAAISVF